MLAGTRAPNFLGLGNADPPAAGQDHDPFADGILNPSVVPFERIRQAMLDEHRPERPCRAEVNLAIEMDVAEFPITDVEVSTTRGPWVLRRVDSHE
jgi:hypothetical protein